MTAGPPGDRRRLVASDLETARYDASDGQGLIIEVRILPTLDEQQQVVGAGIIFDDIRAAARLRESYRQLHEELETAYEELQSTNEELETSNEELQSSHEELETSNEELQSTNEELETTNEELRLSNDELESTNIDLKATTEAVELLTRHWSRPTATSCATEGSTAWSWTIPRRHRRAELAPAGRGVEQRGGEHVGVGTGRGPGASPSSGWSSGFPSSPSRHRCAPAAPGARSRRRSSYSAVDPSGGSFTCRVTVVPIGGGPDFSAMVMMQAVEQDLP